MQNRTKIKSKINRAVAGFANRRLKLAYLETAVCKYVVHYYCYEAELVSKYSYHMYMVAQQGGRTGGEPS